MVFIKDRRTSSFVICVSHLKEHVKEAYLDTKDLNDDQLLMQYFKKHDTDNNMKLQEGIQEAFVTISLGRQLLGVILNIIIPTIVLLIISYSTNFYKDDYFESVVAINLTTMLVIVTLFVSVCNNNKSNST